MSDTPPPPDDPVAPGGPEPDPSETTALPTTQPQPAYEPPADQGYVPPAEPVAPPPPDPSGGAPGYAAPADPGYAAPPADPGYAAPPADPGYGAAGYAAAAAPGYPPTQPQPEYAPPGGVVGPSPAGPPGAPGAYPPAGGYGAPPAGPPPTQAGWGAGGGAVPPAYGAPPPSGGGGKKVLMIVLTVFGVLFLGLVALVVIGALTGDDGDDAPSVDRTTIAPPATAPDFDETTTTQGPQPGDSVLDDTTTTGGSTTSINVFDLEAGDCFDVPESGNITDVDGIDCDEPHDNEVFATFDVAGGPNAPFPGSAAISAQAQARCTGALFTDYVGVPFQQSVFNATSINPTQQTWEELDDREVICVATSADGQPLTSSVRDANR